MTINELREKFGNNIFTLSNYFNTKYREDILCYNVGVEIAQFYIENLKAYNKDGSMVSSDIRRRLFDDVAKKIEDNINFANETNPEYEDMFVLPILYEPIISLQNGSMKFTGYFFNSANEEAVRDSWNVEVCNLSDVMKEVDAFVNKSYPNYKFEYRADKEREATDSKCLFDDMKSALDIRLKELGISLDNKEL